MADEEYDPSQVVMRRQKEAVGRYKLNFGLVSSGDLGDEVDGGKKVKWSDSTELREKMKEYRRSQLSICLDYQHIAVEEEREREGVKRWREIKDAALIPDEQEEEEEGSKEATPIEPEEEKEEEEEHLYFEVIADEDIDSDDDPYCDQVLEQKLRVIKAISSRHTILPAYVASVKSYEEWLASESSSATSEQHLTQLDVYKQIVTQYNSWDDADQPDTIDPSYKTIMEKMLEGKNVCEPPQVVADAMAAVLNDEENIRRHKDVYSGMVDAMVTDLSKQIQTTTL